MPTCTVDDCEKPARSARAVLCKMHYHRQYRHGSVDRVIGSDAPTASLGRRYVTAYMPHHPIARGNGKVYVHRAVLYDAIGPGPHACHWCRATVDWVPKGMPGCLQVDHLDGDGANNDGANLVPSCPACNTTRAEQARHEVLKAAGWWSCNDTIARLKGRARRPPVVAAEGTS